MRKWYRGALKDAERWNMVAEYIEQNKSKGDYIKPNHISENIDVCNKLVGKTLSVMSEVDVGPEIEKWGASPNATYLVLDPVSVRVDWSGSGVE